MKNREADLSSSSSSSSSGESAKTLSSMEMDGISPLPSSYFNIHSASSPPYPKLNSDLVWNAGGFGYGCGARSDVEDGEFEFDFSGQLRRTSLTADELFDGGLIRPMKPLFSLQLHDAARTHISSSIAPKWKISQSKSTVEEEFPPQHKNIGDRDTNTEGELNNLSKDQNRHSSSLPSHLPPKVSRSQSPRRIADILQDPEENPSSTISDDWESDKKTREKVKMSRLRRKGPVPDEEVQCREKSVASETMKKSFLPYRQRLLCCLPPCMTCT